MTGSLPNDSNGINKLDGNPLRENEAFFKEKKVETGTRRRPHEKKEKMGSIKFICRLVVVVRMLANVAGVSHNMPHITDKISHE